MTTQTTTLQTRAEEKRDSLQSLKASIGQSNFSNSVTGDPKNKNINWGKGWNKGWNKDGS
jgi:hypothetical protein